MSYFWKARTTEPWCTEHSSFASFESALGSLIIYLTFIVYSNFTNEQGPRTYCTYGDETSLCKQYLHHIVAQISAYVLNYLLSNHEPYRWSAAVTRVSIGAGTKQNIQYNEQMLEGTGRIIITPPTPRDWDIYIYLSISKQQ